MIASLLVKGIYNKAPLTKNTIVTNKINSSLIASSSSLLLINFIKVLYTFITKYISIKIIKYLLNLHKLFNSVLFKLFKLNKVFFPSIIMYRQIKDLITNKNK